MHQNLCPFTRVHVAWRGRSSHCLLQSSSAAVSLYLSVLHCSRLQFHFQASVHRLCPDLRGGKESSPSAPCVVFFPCWLLCIFVLAIQDSCLVCTELVFLSPHTCPSDHCDRQCASYALNKNESIKKKTVVYCFIHWQHFRCVSTDGWHPFDEAKCEVGLVGSLHQLLNISKQDERGNATSAVREI